MVYISDFIRDVAATSCGMNKYLSLSLFAVILLGSGFVYQEFYRPAEVGGVPPSGTTVEIDMRVLKDQWLFEPSEIRVDPGDKVRLNIYNEDKYDHGFAIDVFGVNRRLFPKRTTVIEFNASLRGRINFYCSVPCGDGHYDQRGVIIVGDENILGTEDFAHKTYAMAEGRRCQNSDIQ